MTFSAAPIAASACGSTCPNIIVASGVIDSGTPEAFREFVRRLQLTAARPNLLYLDSPGGNVVASMELGTEFRRLRIAAIIGEYDGHSGPSSVLAGQCASACVYAFMGAVRRLAPAVSRVALHRMSMIAESGDDAGRRRFADGHLVAIVARYAQRMGVSPTIVAAAESLSPDQMKLLQPQEMLHARLATSLF